MLSDGDVWFWESWYFPAPEFPEVSISQVFRYFRRNKEIRGFIYYPQQETPQPLLADRISLMRYHATDSFISFT